MSQGNAKAGLALVAGILLGALLGWWLRGDDAPGSGEDGAETARPDEAVAARPRRTASRTERSPRPVEETTAPSATSAATEGGAPGASHAAPATARRDGPADTAPQTAPGATPEASAQKPAVSDVPAREARGVVVDASTQQPVAGARVLYTIVEGKSVGGWWGDTTNADGRFANRVHDDRDLAGTRFEVRVSKDGYEPARVPAGDGEYRVELRPRTTPVVPGRVVGFVRGADGKAASGEIEVEGFDGEGSNVAQRTVADAGGAFVLEGMTPGPWRLRWNRGPMAECTVPDGGEARVELVGAAERSQSGFVVTDVDPSKVTLENGDAKARLAKLQGLLADVAGATDLDGAARERLQRALAQEVQILAESAQTSMPRRELVVTDLPAGARTWVRLETRPRHFRRAEAVGGAVRFPAVPVATTFTAVLVRPGSADRSMQVVVPVGEGPFEIAFR